MPKEKTAYSEVGGDGNALVAEVINETNMNEKEVDKMVDEMVDEMVPIEKPRPKPVRMSNFDGLRGVGVSVVLIYHMGYHLFKNAWLVISMFFSASGFLITAITVESFERRGTVDILKFWAKRVSRLFPALLLMCAILVVTQKFRIDDGITFQREAEDLYYAIFFLTNYNLVYNNKDDYFDDFAKPSITRHLWTLSIEEQYYIVWPLIMWTLTTIFGRKRSSDLAYPEEKLEFWELSRTMRRAITALVFMDLGFMTISYFSAQVTLEAMGTSAAYYSTWCRMGDIAAGGLAYNLVRIHPMLGRRYLRDPTVPKLTFKQRLFIEFLTCMSVIATVFLPMIQREVDDMLVMYFDWFRLPFSFFMGLFCTGGMFQYSEPLERWMIGSRFLSWKPLMLLGVMSYGVYLIHWPLIVFFGDPKGQAQQKHELLGTEADSEFIFNLKNLILFVVSILIGFISFMFYEKPVMMKSRKTRPIKTILTGFFFMGLTCFWVWMWTKDLPPIETFENDLEAIEDIFGDVEDDRYTPFIATILSSRHGTGQSTLYYNVLDSNTRANSGWHDDYVPDEHDVYTRVNKYAHRDTSNTTTLVMCKVLATRHPCHDDFYDEFDYVHWTEDTAFVWLESEKLCYSETIYDEEHGDPAYPSLQSGFDERCDEKIRIREVVVEDTYSDRTANIELLVKVDEAFPDQLNYETMYRIKKDWDAYKNGDLDEPYDPITMTIIGESISTRLGNIWNNFLLDVYEEDESSDFPGLKINNLGHRGMTPIGYFVCESSDPNYQYDRCDELTEEPFQIIESFERTKPDIAMIHDQHWHTDYDENEDNLALQTQFDRMLAMNLMVNDAVENDVDGLFYHTISISDDSDSVANLDYYVEMQNLMEVIDFLSCKKDNNKSILFSVIDWAWLVCPTVETGKCPQKAHGFDSILPDGTHPKGESGDWLGYNALSMIVAETALRLLPDENGGDEFQTWDEAMTNPISEQLLILAPPDDNPPLEDLISSYYICPDIEKTEKHHDFAGLEDRFNATVFPDFVSYKDNENCLN